MLLYLLLYKHYYGSLRIFGFLSCIVYSLLVCECSVLLIIVYMVYVLCSFSMYSFFSLLICHCVSWLNLSIIHCCCVSVLFYDYAVLFKEEKIS